MKKIGLHCLTSQVNSYVGQRSASLPLHTWLPFGDSVVYDVAIVTFRPHLQACSSAPVTYIAASHTTKTNQQGGCFLVSS